MLGWLWGGVLKAHVDMRAQSKTSNCAWAAAVTRLRATCSLPHTTASIATLQPKATCCKYNKANFVCVSRSYDRCDTQLCP
eukprot:SAG31_NODE_32702_length_352_cov_1.438735_1_plen_80_part_10